MIKIYYIKGILFMKKVAIMTWINYPNYGSILQAYALKTYLNKLGYDVTFINYVPKKQHHLNQSKNSYNIKKIQEFIKNKKVKKNNDLLERQLIFNKFVESNFKTTKQLETDSQLNQLNKEFDYFVCGSDQIWSPLVFDKKYFLNFVDCPEKMIAYAPSMGGSNVKDVNIYNEMQHLISRFSHISIREQQGKEIIKKMINKDVPVVCDPTLLIDKEEWSKFAKTRIDEKKYTIVYFLGDSKFYWNYIDQLEDKGHNIIIIPTKHYHYSKKYKVLNKVSPQEFLGLIKNAEAVCTDSYHGTIFAQIFEVPYLTMQRFKNNDYNEQNSRIINLLKDTGNIERLVDDYNKDKIKLLQSKPNIDIKIKFKIDASKAYLSNALKSKKKIVNKEYKISQSCSGCGVCSISCPKQAIECKLNDSGFYKAYIDNQKCIKCGICKSVCGFNAEVMEFNANTEVVAARAKDSEIISNTTSGGIAHVLSILLSEKGYDVVGCKYDYITNKAKHVYIDVVNDKEYLDKINELRGSKYLQSYTVEAFDKIKKSKKGMIVGTPCQIASLNNYLEMKKVRDKFVLIDLICHGVPTYNLWDKYLNYVQRKYNIGEIKKIMFRKKIKENDNNNMNLFIEGSKESIITPQENDLFYRSFCIGNCYAQSCYECNFRKASLADIRLGDYWGEKYKDKNGTSMVIPLTTKGKNVINELEEKYIVSHKGNINDYIKHQQTFNLNPPFYYHELMEDLKNNTKLLEDIDGKYNKRYYSIKKIKKIVKFVIRRD